MWDVNRAGKQVHRSALPVSLPGVLWVLWDGSQPTEGLAGGAELLFSLQSSVGNEKPLLLCDTSHLCLRQRQQQWGKRFADGGTVGAVAERRGRGEAEGAGGQGAGCCGQRVHSCGDKQAPQGVGRQIQVQHTRLPGERTRTLVHRWVLSASMVRS